jgi:hypothetical protein
MNRTLPQSKKSATAKSWADCGLALAVFVKRPQADAQIGAVVAMVDRPGSNKKPRTKRPGLFTQPPTF